MLDLPSAKCWDGIDFYACSARYPGPPPRHFFLRATYFGLSFPKSATFPLAFLQSVLSAAKVSAIHYTHTLHMIEFLAFLTYQSIPLVFELSLSTILVNSRDRRSTKHSSTERSAPHSNHGPVWLYARSSTPTPITVAGTYLCTNRIRTSADFCTYGCSCTKPGQILYAHTVQASVNR